MPIDHTIFNLERGIDGIAQSPSQAKTLEALPQSQQVLPNNSLFLRYETNTQNASTLLSNWDKNLQDFVMPNITSSVLVPAELKSRLNHIRKKINKRAHSKHEPALLALNEVLQDDAELQEVLHSFRSALVQA